MASEGPTKMKEFEVSVSGTYRVSFEVRCSTNISNRAKVVIYRNGEVYGTIGQDGESPYDTYSVVTEDLYFQIGDLIQLYLESVIDVAYARNFRLLGDIGTGVGAEINV